MSDDFTFDDADDARPAPMPDSDRPADRLSILRFLTPGTFVAGVVLFFLPWTDLSCTSPAGRMQVATQSGYQSAVGELSEGEDFPRLREAMGADDKFDINKARKDPFEKGAAKEPADGGEKAPLLWLYLGLLVAGALVPVFVAGTQVRGAIVLGFVGFAALLLALQMILGFPLANDVAKMNDLKPVGGPGRNPFGAEPKVEIKSSYLASFWGSIGLLVVSAGLGLVQVVAGRPEGRRGRRPRRSRDDPD